MSQTKCQDKTKLDLTFITNDLTLHIFWGVNTKQLPEEINDYENNLLQWKKYLVQPDWCFLPTAISEK